MKGFQNRHLYHLGKKYTLKEVIKLSPFCSEKDPNCLTLTNTSQIYGASWIHLPHIPLRVAISCQRYTEQTLCSCSNPQITRMAAPLFTLQSSGTGTVCLLCCSCACWDQHFKDFYVHLKVSFPGSTLWNLTHYIRHLKLAPTFYSFLTDCSAIYEHKLKWPESPASNCSEGGRSICCAFSLISSLKILALYGIVRGNYSTRVKPGFHHRSSNLTLQRPFRTCKAC